VRVAALRVGGGAHRQLGADDRADPGGARRLVEARRAVHAVPVEQRERRVAEIGRAVDDRFRQRGAFQKAERGSGVELDVREHGGTGNRSDIKRKTSHFELRTCLSPRSPR